jgi:hypothetical protein
MLSWLTLIAWPGRGVDDALGECVGAEQAVTATAAARVNQRGLTPVDITDAIPDSGTKFGRAAMYTVSRLGIR